MLSDATFSRTKCARPTIAATGTICIILVCLTTRMNQSIQSAQPCRSLYFVDTTTAYFWTWGCTIHCWVFLHQLEKIDIVFPAARCTWNWRIWFSGVQQEYNTGREGTRSWKVLSRSLSVYWTQMSWESVMIPWLALVYSTLHLWVRLIWYFCTLQRHGFLTNDVPLVTQGAKMVRPHNAGGVKDALCKYFTIYLQKIVGWKLLPSQYCTSLVGQDMRVCPP